MFFSHVFCSVKWNRNGKNFWNWDRIFDSMQYVYSTYYVYVYVVFTKDILRLPTSIPGKSFFYKHPCNSLEWWWRILWRMLYLQETLTFQILNIYFEFHKNTKTEIWGTKNFEKRIRFSSKKNSWLYFTVSKNLKIEKNWEELRRIEKKWETENPKRMFCMAEIWMKNKTVRYVGRRASQQQFQNNEWERGALLHYGTTKH